MKVLFVTDSIYEQSIYTNSRMITGLAVMCRDICDEISKRCECYVLPYRLKNKDIITCQNIHILQSGVTNLLRYYTLNLFYQSIRSLFSKKEKKLLYLKLLYNYFSNLYNKYKFDLVHFHDITSVNLALIKECENQKIPYVVTMHMYVGQKYRNLKEVFNQYSVYEDNCRIAFNSYQEMNVVTVSSGMKERIATDYPNFNPQNITVILNSSKYAEEVLRLGNISLNIEKKILLIIGSVQTRKNQIQLFHAIKYIPESLLSEIEFHFIGNDKEGVLNKKIKEYGLENTCKYLGIIPHKDLAEHYNNSFATISLSLLESFGLTFIESFAFGKPVIMFDDLDAFEDIYTEDCCVPITEHTDEAVANAIINCVNKTWDEAKIKQHAKKFNMDTLRESYISLYNNILNNDTTENNSRNRL